MKKLLPLFVCFILILCKKEDEIIIFEGKQSDLIGVWVLKSANLGGIDLELDECRKQETITVNSMGDAIWKNPGLITDSCDPVDKKLKFLALNSNFTIKYESETITYHGKFLEPGMVEIISIFKIDELETKSIYIFTKK
ncbi:hypothetical protein ABW636_02385 [Aquimarina sp. 2201CG1-2-11]|uniref:hypothetical protein n=1 Tax=Aquimarina discodermiae TaxID=3231043 RepID=UPI00346356ED